MSWLLSGVFALATLRDIRRRISSIQNIQQVTRAMYLVAAARVRRAQEGLLAARPYAQEMRTLLQNLAFQEDPAVHPLISKRKTGGLVCLVVVTSDRGLCGSFNASLIRRAVSQIEAYGERPHEIICVGRKGLDFFRKRKFLVARDYLGVFQNLEFKNAVAIAEEIMDRFSTGELNQVDVIYNQFGSVIQQEVIVDRFLPIPARKSVQNLEMFPEFVDYLFEPDPKGVLDLLVPRHLHFQIWRMLLESNAAEQGARMTAMDNATKNAGDLIDELMQDLNKARQTAITLELMDIVGGAEALEG